MIGSLRWAGRGSSALSDNELLAQFVASRDEDAFAALVRRHGPLVLAVCRRVTADDALADDTFQAVFLVLAQKADTVHPPGAVRGWLYGVATRTAVRARAMSGRRKRWETLVGAVPDRGHLPDPGPEPDTLRVLDEEVARLPDHLRGAVVLCELDGVGRREAAARLGVPEGTLSSRLAKARKLLARRLAGRGVVAPAAGLAAMASSSPVSAKLAATTARVAVGAESPTALASALYQETLRTMFRTTLRSAGTLAGLFILATALMLYASDQPPPLPPAAPTPKPAAREPVLMLWREGAPVFLRPDGTVTDRPDPSKWAGKLPLAGAGRLSPDGARILVTTTDDGITYRHAIRPGVGTGAAVEVARLTRGSHAFWSRDGRHIYVCGEKPEKTDGPSAWVVDVASGKRSAVPVPAGCQIRDLSPTGRQFLTFELGGGPAARRAPHLGRTYLTTPGDKPDHVRLAPELGDLGGLSFSPDGSKVLARRPVVGSAFGHIELVSIDVATGTAVQLNQGPDELNLYSACWSPDGKRVAYVWWEASTTAAPPPTVRGFAAPTNVNIDSHVMIVDADGKNRKRIHTEKGARVPGIDWR